ncbi:hypothetical protein Tco_1556922 [Tanacetum coccineum]
MDGEDLSLGMRVETDSMTASPKRAAFYEWQLKKALLKGNRRDNPRYPVSPRLPKINVTRWLRKGLFFPQEIPHYPLSCSESELTSYEYFRQLLYRFGILPAIQGLD